MNHSISVSSTTLYALHGFLGSPSDWDCFTAEHFAMAKLVPIPLNLSPSLHDWATQFVQSHPTPGVLMGYSLGARLALHALIQRPDLWKAAVIISAHPGLSDIQEKAARLEQDKKWAQQFLTEPWDLLLKRWNGQKTLMDSLPIHREELHYDRKTLAHALEHWSLGLQADLREAISQLPMPILWVYGEKDKRYEALANSLSFAHPHSTTKCIAGSGHRVAWDQPYLFHTQVRHWLCTSIN